MGTAPRQFDIAVVGAGMVGATAASMLARCGFAVVLIEERSPQAFDSGSTVGLRVCAISPGSAAILEQAGAWAEIVKLRSCPYRRMHVEDQGGQQSEDGRIPADMDFEATAFGMERLGTIVENELVQSALWRAVEANPMVRILCPASLTEIEQRIDSTVLVLDGGERVEAALVIGGRRRLLAHADWRL